MSNPGTTAAPSLANTIISDIESEAAWLLTEAEGLGGVVWNILKNSLVALSQAQWQIAIAVFNTLQTDALAGKSIEEIETDMLTVASADELAVLKSIGSADLQSVIAQLKANLPA